MIASGLKKLAQENGMKVAQGVAYGSLRGFGATMSEGSGYKQIILTTKFRDPAKLMQLQEQVNQRNISREFRVQKLDFLADGVVIIFNDNPGTMGKIRAFIDWFFPLLEESSATPVHVCTECGCEITAGRWVMVNGVAFYLHDSCAQKVRRDIDEENTQRKEERTGSYALGLVGALGGSIIGAIVWAIVLNLGYVASLVGLLIGWLAEKGYNLLKGKQGKAKVAILILAVIVGVLLGTFAADAMTLMGMISDGELTDFVMGDIPTIIWALFTADAEYRAATLANIGTGLLFAGLGVFAMLWKAGKAVADTKFIELE